MTAETEDKTTQNWLKEVQKGYIRIGVLILLNKKPSHGYEIMKEIKNRTKGFWQPTAGGVYPILRDLEQSGYIKGQWQTQRNRRLKIYRITKSGETILRRAIIKQSEISNNISSLFREFARDVLNIQVANDAMPNFPSVFSPFLEDEHGGEESLPDLEAKRRQMQEAVVSMRRRLIEIDRKISLIKKQSQPSSESPV
jgi:PadR family transcriptional regulator PadR